MPSLHPKALLAALLSVTPFLQAATTPRTVESFDTKWRFLQSDAPQAEQAAFDDSAWLPVILPHDWSIAGPVDQKNPSGPAGGFFPTGIGWYRKTFTGPRLDPTRRTFIAFDGVMANSDVYLNGHLLGHRPYGYVSFNYDLTPYLHPGSNTIAVRVDNSQQPASRWYPGAGINRHVRLVTTGDVHILPWGTFVTTPSVAAGNATIHVQATITNDTATPLPLDFILAAALISPTGH